MRRRLLASGLVLAAAVVAAFPAAAARHPSLPTIGGCQVFPATNAWNRDVSHDPVDPRSARWLAGLDGNLHPDFGSDFGIPYVVVPKTQRKVPITFTAYG